MSHYTVAVLSRSPKDVDTLLAPFNENDESYMTFFEVDIQPDIDTYNSTPAAQAQYHALHTYLVDGCGYIQDADTGAYGLWRNPNSKWDWYEIGGRWKNMLILKPDTKATSQGALERLLTFDPVRPGPVRCDQAKIKNVCLESDRAAYQQALRFWEVAVEGKPQKEDDLFTVFYKPEYYLEQYGAKEKYAEEQASFQTFAFLTPDGEWYEKGEMGWFGLSTATEASRLSYAELFNQHVLCGDPELYITIVDCHI